MNRMDSLTLTLPDGGALTLAPGRLACCAHSADNLQALTDALLAAGHIVLALPAHGGLISPLSVADNLTLAASYHGVDWAWLDAELARLLTALAMPAEDWPTLLSASAGQLDADNRRLALLLRAMLTPGAAWLIDSDFFADTDPALAARGRALLAHALPGRLAVWLMRPPRDAHPGADFLEMSS